MDDVARHCQATQDHDKPKKGRCKKCSKWRPSLGKQSGYCDACMKLKSDCEEREAMRIHHREEAERNRQHERDMEVLRMQSEEAERQFRKQEQERQHQHERYMREEERKFAAKEHARKLKIMEKSVYNEEMVIKGLKRILFEQQIMISERQHDNQEENCTTGTRLNPHSHQAEYDSMDTKGV